MKNPCKECLVSPMCSNICQAKEDYFDIKQNRWNIGEKIIDSLIGICVFVAVLVTMGAMLINGAR